MVNIPAAYLKTRKSEQDMHLNASLLGPFFNYLESVNVGIDEFDEIQLTDYLRGGYKCFARKGELSKNTLCQIYDAVKRFLKWQVRRANETGEWFRQRQRLARIEDYVRRPEVEGHAGRKWLTLGELKDLFEIARHDDERAYLVLKLTAYFGTRKNELLRKERRVEIDFGENKFVVRTEKWKEGKIKTRVLYFNGEIAADFKRALETGALDVSDDWLYRHCWNYKPLFKEIDFTLHCLRHTFNHHMRLRLGNDMLLKVLMGHKTGRDMSDYYDGVIAEQIKKAMLEKHYFNDLGEVNYPRVTSSHG